MRDYSARWLFIAGCALVGAIMLVVLRIGMDAGSAWPRVQFVLLLALLAAVLGRLGRTAHPRLRRPLAVSVDFCLSLAQLVAAVAVIAPFSYLAAMSGLPLLDAELARLDAMLGFEWESFYRWVGERPAVRLLLKAAYESLLYQPLIALLVGSVLCTGERNREVVWLTSLGLAICIAISALTPAVGMGELGGLSYAEAYKQVRNGAWSVVDYNKFEGIVTFPSFHMASAVFLIYVARHSPWVLAVSVPLNVAMMAATPIGGGHYLVDLLAGGAVALACILLVRRMERRGARTAPPAPLPRPAFPAEGLSAG